MNKEIDYVQFTISSTHPSYDGVSIKMTLDAFLNLMEVTDFQSQLEVARPAKKQHPIRDF